MDARARPGTVVAEELAVDSRQHRRLRAYALKRFGIPAEDAEDLLQETMLELLRAGSVLRPQGFVFRLFHTRCCRYVERCVRQRTPLPPPAASPLPVELDLALRQGFSELTASCRGLLTAYYIEGQSLKSTASRMALAHSGVWKLINRCLKRLRSCLER